MFNNKKAQQVVVTVALLALLLSGLATLFVPSGQPTNIAPAPEYSIDVEGV
jgi:hypothetical protein